jgi:large repetitive protein
MPVCRAYKMCIAAFAFVVTSGLSSCGSTGTNFSITGALPDVGTVGTAYAATLTAVGGDGGDHWTVMGLPDGVTATGTSSATLTLSGTPTTPGTDSVSASVQDTHGTIVVTSASVLISSPSIAVSPGSLGTLTAGQALSGITFTATPATTGPYTWTVI